MWKSLSQIKQVWKLWRNKATTEQRLLQHLGVDVQKQIWVRHSEQVRVLTNKLVEGEAKMAAILANITDKSNKDLETMVQSYEKELEEEFPSDDKVHDMINRIVRTHKRENVIADLEKLGLDSSFIERTSFGDVEPEKTKVFVEYIFKKSIEESLEQKFPLLNLVATPDQLKARVNELNSVKEELKALDARTEKELQQAMSELTQEERELLSQAEKQVKEEDYKQNKN